MKTINKLRLAIESVGGSLDEYGEFFCLDAPSGYVWRATGCPSYTIHWASRSQTWLSQAIREESESLRMGFERITDENAIAEVRWSSGDDTWGAAPDSPDFITFTI